MYINKVSPDSPLGAMINMCYYHLKENEAKTVTFCVVVLVGFSYS